MYEIRDGASVRLPRVEIIKGTPSQSEIAVKSNKIFTDWSQCETDY
jgi:hypothetical protein